MSEELTREQHERLKAELAELEGPKRAEIVEAIAVARGHGDLSENFEYHAAKNEQGLLERRIRVLRARLENSIVVDEPAHARGGTASIGTVSYSYSGEASDTFGKRGALTISATLVVRAGGGRVTASVSSASY